MHMKKSVLLLILTISILNTPVGANDRSTGSHEIPFTLKDSDRLARIETLVELMDKRIDQIDKRINKIEFSEHGTPTGEINNSSNDLRKFLFVGFGITILSMLALIVYILWDRRRLYRDYGQPRN